MIPAIELLDAAIVALRDLEGRLARLRDRGVATDLDVNNAKAALGLVRGIAARHGVDRAIPPDGPSR